MFVADLIKHKSNNVGRNGLIQHAYDPFKDNVLSETNVQNFRTNMNATINKGKFKNHITHERHTTASMKDAPTYGTDNADVKTTLPVLTGITGGNDSVMLHLDPVKTKMLIDLKKK